MATLSATGLGTGFDINGLVTQLVAAEGEPAQQQLTRRESRLVAELSSLGTLKGALSELESSLGRINSAPDFRAISATSSDEALFTVSANGIATVGQYAVDVTRLAQFHKLASATFGATDTFGGDPSDNLKIDIDGHSLTIDLSTPKSLGAIRDAINNAEDNPGVTASLINVDQGQQTLVLTARDPGHQNHIEVTEQLQTGSLSLATANQDANGNPLTDLTELDASVRIDGITINRSSNQIGDAIDGVTLNLHKAQPGTLANLSVGYDLDAINSAVSNFVDKYNTLVATLDQVSGYQGEGVQQPALFGDAMTRSIGNRLRTELGRTLTGLEGPFSNLGELGITTKTDGTLELDAGKLNGVLAQDREAVGELFSSEDGLASRLAPVLSTYLGTEGILETRTDGVQERLDGIGDRRLALERRLVTLEGRYMRQFSAMDALVGQLTSTSNFLTQQLQSLPGAFKQNRNS